MADSPKLWLGMDDTVFITGGLFVGADPPVLDLDRIWVASSDSCLKCGEPDEWGFLAAHFKLDNPKAGKLYVIENGIAREVV